MGRSHCPRCGGAINTMEAGCVYCGTPIPPDRELHEEDRKRLRVLAEALDTRIWAESPLIEYRLGLRYWLVVTGLAVLAGASAWLTFGALPFSAVAMALQCGLALLVYYQDFAYYLKKRAREAVHQRTVRPALRTVLSAYNIHEAHWQALILQMKKK